MTNTSLLFSTINLKNTHCRSYPLIFASSKRDKRPSYIKKHARIARV